MGAQTNITIKSPQENKTGQHSEPLIALLGQPNAGKSTLFNGLTGSHQHVGNWPGKTVEQKEGYFIQDGKKYTVVDLPGTYSLSANSQEEVVTRDYIAEGKPDLVCVLADASQLERSLFLLADYAGITVPIILLVNMMDVAKEQGKNIDCAIISKKLGIHVIPFTASELKGYSTFYDAVKKTLNNPCTLRTDALMDFYKEMPDAPYQRLCDLMPSEGIDAYSPAWLSAKLIEGDPMVLATVSEFLKESELVEVNKLLSSVKDGSLLTGNCKFRWIDSILKDAAISTRADKPKMSRFDRVATSRTWGKPLAITIIILALIVSLIPALPLMLLGKTGMGIFGTIVAEGLTSVGVPHILVSLLCDAIIGAIGFVVSMVGFVLGISLVFGFLEEIGYMARISYVFDNTMSKLGLQGKAVMPFLVSFGCTIGGAAGTRVIDTWGQRVLTIALAWAVPCSGTWAVVALVSATFFGAGAPLVIISLFATALLHMLITSKIFRNSLVKESDKTGLIMELPPYHKPKWKNLFRFLLNRFKDVFVRAFKLIVLVSVVFWILSYTNDGDITHSIIYKIGTFIEPVTSIFGLKWRMFMAFVVSGMGKEAALGVMNTLFSIGSAVNLSDALLNGVSKAEALAFIYAFTFNIPCISALAATYEETHSLKWVLRITCYYIAAALIMSFVVYHIGLLVF